MDTSLNAYNSNRDQCNCYCYEYIYIFLIKPSNRDQCSLYWNYKRLKRYPSLISSLLKHSALAPTSDAPHDQV